MLVIYNLILSTVLLLFDLSISNILHKNIFSLLLLFYYIQVINNRLMIPLVYYVTGYSLFLILIEFFIFKEFVFYNIAFVLSITYLIFLIKKFMTPSFLFKSTFLILIFSIYFLLLQNYLY